MILASRLLADGLQFARPQWALFALALVALIAVALRWRGATAAARRRALMAAAPLIAVGWLLSMLDTSQARFALAALLVAVALGAAWGGYRHVGGVMPAFVAGVCVIARGVVWVGALLLLAGPAWESTEVHWRKPTLALRFDQSLSMNLSDADPRDSDRPTRAAIANAALKRADGAFSRLRNHFEVDARDLEGAPLEAPYRLAAARPVTPLAQSLSAVAAIGPEPALYVVLVSDGAETAADASGVRNAARGLAEQNVGVLTFGVGAAPEQRVHVEFDPLDAPARVGLRDKLPIGVSARIAGCDGARVSLELALEGQTPERRTIAITSDGQRVAERFTLRPAEAGVRRVTARITLPESLGGDTFEHSALIDVRDDALRVVVVERAPRSELGFTLRALRSDTNITAESLLLSTRSAIEASATIPWDAYDVIVLGALRHESLPDDVARQIVEAVRERGVGLLIAGGADMLASAQFARGPFAAVCPVALPARPRGDRLTTVRVSDAGAAHPVFEGTDIATFFTATPAVEAAVTLSETKSIATALAADADNDPLLATHEFGRGRVAVAAWDTTWRWALASDAGFAAHQAYWRQLATWLANRRPTAWAHADQLDYNAAGLRDRAQEVLLTAGVSGLGAQELGRAGLTARFTIRRLGGADDPGADGPDGPLEWDVPAESTDAGWRARWPGAEVSAPLPGEYEVVARFSGRADGAAAGAGLNLRANTRFRVLAAEALEFRPPTANAQLLREIAEVTRDAGGAYYDVGALAETLERLSATDRRRRDEVTLRFDPARRDPWLIFGVILSAWALEWALRKRFGLP